MINLLITVFGGLLIIGGFYSMSFGFSTPPDFSLFTLGICSSVLGLILVVIFGSRIDFSKKGTQAPITKEIPRQALKKEIKNEKIGKPIRPTPRIVKGNNSTGKSADKKASDFHKTEEKILKIRPVKSEGRSTGKEPEMSLIRKDSRAAETRDVINEKPVETQGAVKPKKQAPITNPVKPQKAKKESENRSEDPETTTKKPAVKPKAPIINPKPAKLTNKFVSNQKPVTNSKPVKPVKSVTKPKSENPVNKPASNSKPEKQGKPLIKPVKKSSSTAKRIKPVKKAKTGSEIKPVKGSTINPVKGSAVKPANNSTIKPVSSSKVEPVNNSTVNPDNKETKRVPMQSVLTKSKAKKRRGFNRFRHNEDKDDEFVKNRLERMKKDYTENSKEIENIIDERLDSFKGTLDKLKFESQEPSIIWSFDSGNVKDTLTDTISKAENRVLMMYPWIRNIDVSVLKKFIDTESRMIIQEASLDDETSVELIKVLLDNNVKIRTMPSVHTVAVVADKKNGLIISTDPIYESFEVGVVYKDPKSIEEIEKLFEDAWNISKDINLEIKQW